MPAHPPAHWVTACLPNGTFIRPDNRPSRAAVLHGLTLQEIGPHANTTRCFRTRHNRRRRI